MHSVITPSRRKILGSALTVLFGRSLFADRFALAATKEPLSEDGPDLDTLVAGIAFSPDGRTVAGGGKALRLWDLQSGQLSRTFDEGAGSTTSVAYSPDGRFVACGSGNAATIRLQDVLHDKLVWEQSSGPVATLAFAHDGRSLVSGGLPFEFTRWETASGRVMREFKGHTEAGQSVCFTPDDRLIVTGSEDKTVKLWDAASGKALATVPTKDAAIELAFTPDGRSVLCLFRPDKDDVIMRLDIASRKFTQQAAVSATHFDIGAFSQDARLVAVGDGGSMVVSDTRTGKPIRTIRSKGGYLDPLAFSPDGKFIARGGEKNTVRVWEVDSGRLARTMRA